MKTYLGFIEQRTTYYNFRIQHAFEDGKIESVEAIPEKFPVAGSLNLAYERYGESHEYLDKLGVDFKQMYSIYAVNVDERFVYDNPNDIIKRKLELQDMARHLMPLREIVKSAAALEIYKVVPTSLLQIPELEEQNLLSGRIFINDKEKDKYAVGEKILLSFNEKICGPYELKERAVDGGRYFEPNIGSINNRFILEYCKEKEVDIWDFDRQYNYYDPIVKLRAACIADVPRYLEDLIPLDELFKKATETIDLNLVKENTEEFERMCRISPFLATNIPEEMRQERLRRLTSNLTALAEFKDAKRDLVLSLLETYTDDEDISKQWNDIVKSSGTYRELLERNSGLEFVRQTGAEQDAEIAAITKKYTDLQKEFDSFREMYDQTQQLEVKYENYKETEKLTELRAQMAEEVRKGKEDRDKLRKFNQQLRERTDELHGEINEAIESALTFDYTKFAQTAFDPYITKAMFEAAGRWGAEEEDAIYERRVKEINTIAAEIAQPLQGDELLDYLVSGVQKFRNYSRNQIINLYICFVQNFITVFSGEPGTGKTTICEILADSLGLRDLERFIPVSVERGWASKRDLIGYYNPLTKKYDKANRKIYDGLMLLDKEREDSKFPYIILLDEANLSPIEYYWADFMRAADRTMGDVYINIGTERELYIPSTLRFLATINNDRTTEPLSPRLIDRAWVIKLPKTATKEVLSDSYNKEFSETPLWSDIQKLFVAKEQKTAVTNLHLKNVVAQIFELFEKHNISVSHRVKQSVNNYISTAQDIMENEGSINGKQKAVDFAVVQKLLPKINGYYTNYKELFNTLSSICDENHLEMTKKEIETMETLQAQNMGYCQYLV
jgi:MoxR-like ATPase